MKKHLLVAVFLVCSSLLMAQPQAGSFSITPKVGMSLSDLSGKKPSLVLVSYNQEDYRKGTTLSAPDTYEADVRCKSQCVTNICLGLEVQKQYTRKLGLTLGCYYAQLGAEFQPEEAAEFSCSEYESALRYIQVPILGKCYLFKGLALEVGLQPGFLIGDDTRRVCTLRGTSFNESQTIKEAPYVFDGKENLYMTGVWGFDGIDKQDFDLSVVLGLSYEFKNVEIDARYHLSTIPVYDEEIFASVYDKCKLRNSYLMFCVGYRFNLFK